MLDFETLSFSFEDQVIFQDLHLTLPPHHYGLIGRNGSGKSTLVKLLLGELHPSKGHILLDGKPLSPSCISCVPERLGFGLDLRVQDFLQYMAGIRGLSIKRMRSIAEQLHFDAFRTPMRDLSYGMLQKINWVQGLAKDSAKIFIMDEATVGLDDDTRNLVLTCFKTHFADRHAFMISHRLDDLLTTSTAFLALKNQTLHPIDIFEYVDVHFKHEQANVIITTTQPYRQKGEIDLQNLLGMENSINFERLHRGQHG